MSHSHYFCTDSSSSEEENGQNSSTLDSGTGGSKDRRNGKAKGPKGKKEMAANGKDEGGSNSAIHPRPKEEEAAADEQPGCSNDLVKATATNLAMKNDIGTQMERIGPIDVENNGSPKKKNIADKNGEEDHYLEAKKPAGIRPSAEMMKTPIKNECRLRQKQQQLPPKRRNPTVGNNSGQKETPASANRTSVIIIICIISPNLRLKLFETRPGPYPDNLSPKPQWPNE
jgi:hypothetical protein